MGKWDDGLETVTVPVQMVDLAQRRTRPILHRAILFPNALEVVMLSCYLQGLEDGYTVARRRKESPDA